MEFDTSDINDQAAWAYECEYDGLIEQELKIRKLARDVAEKYVSYSAGFPPIQIPFPKTSYNTTGSYPATSNSYMYVEVDLHPGIQGEARVLLAEKIIRQQLGVDLP